jgi:hypothetical protein
MMWVERVMTYKRSGESVQDAMRDCFEGEVESSRVAGVIKLRKMKKRNDMIDLL